jgi:hypothetical protein
MRISARLGYRLEISDADHNCDDSLLTQSLCSENSVSSLPGVVSIFGEPIRP